MTSVTKLVVAVGVLGFALGSVARAADKADGKQLYRENCKVCHEKGSKGGEYTPMNKLQAQWRSFFKDKLAVSHKNLPTPDNKKVLDTLSPEQLKVIEKFVVDHAADSEQPATCG